MSIEFMVTETRIVLEREQIDFRRLAAKQNKGKLMKRVCEETIGMIIEAIVAWVVESIIEGMCQ